MAKQINEIEILNKEDRLFKGWAGVEVKDKDDEKITMDEFKKIMPILMDRGGFLCDKHTHFICGKILNYVFEDKNNIPGILITGKVFNNYLSDKEVWEKLLSGEYKGLSLGGDKRNISYDSSDNSTILKDIEGWEISFCEQGANPEANITELNYIAKSDKTIHKDIKKPFAAFKDWDECMNQMKEKYDKETAEKVCGKLKAKFEKIKKAVSGIAKNTDELANWIIEKL